MAILTLVIRGSTIVAASFQLAGFTAGKLGNLPPQLLPGFEAGQKRYLTPFLLTPFLIVLALICLSSAGCVGLGDLVPTTDGPPTGKPCQVITNWNDQVVFTPDPTHGGAPTPGLACRLYLFGEQIGTPMACAGKVTVDIYDVSDPGKEAQPKLLEVLYIDKDTLHRLLRRDMIGWGYTLFLPWGTYNPQIKCVQLKLRYEPVNGTPLFTASKKLTLKDPADTGVLPVKSSSRLINQAAEVRQ